MSTPIELSVKIKTFPQHEDGSFAFAGQSREVIAEHAKNFLTELITYSFLGGGMEGETVEVTIDSHGEA